MPGMPYHLEKGPWLSILEDYLNADPRRLVDALDQFRECRSGRSLADLDFLRSPSLEGDPDYPTLDDRRGHLQNDWFGSTDGRPSNFVEATLRRIDGLPEEQASALREEGSTGTAGGLTRFARSLTSLPDVRFDAWPSTGFWFQYHGDVEGIVRESLIRAMEVAIGIDHDAAAPSVPDRVLPIELFWKCPQRWFEGWVTWRWDPAHRTGQVTLMLATPGSGKPVLENPELGRESFIPSTSRVDAPGDSPTGPGPADSADALQAPKGMWVITHRQHAQLPSPPDDRAMDEGNWLIPSFGPTYVGAGPVICVQPDERDGGVRPFGRPYRDPDPAASFTGD